MKGLDGPVLELLRATVANAYQSSLLYRARLPDGLQLSSLGDFSQIPILSRRDLIALASECMDADTPPDIWALTSGTTSSEASGYLYHFHSLAERQVAHALFSELYALGDTRPLTLRLINLNHGLDFFGTQKGVISVPFEQPYHFNIIVDLLRKRFRFRDYSTRVVSLVAPLNALKTLTSKMIENGIEGSEFGVSSVSCYAWRLTPRWERLLKSFWGAPVLDSYGVSEVPGLFAQKCSDCGYFHFSQSAFVEFLDIDDSSPALDGPARLVATAYFPLSELMPVLRYDTGDIFVRRGRCGSTAKDSYEFLGRRNHLIRVGPRREQIISVGLLVDALDEFTEIQRTQDPRIKSLEIRAEVGNPIFAFDAKRGILELELSVKGSSFASEAERVNFERRVADAVFLRLSRFGASIPLEAISVETSDRPVDQKTMKL